MHFAALNSFDFSFVFGIHICFVVTILWELFQADNSLMFNCLHLYVSHSYIASFDIRIPITLLYVTLAKSLLFSLFLDLRIGLKLLYTSHCTP